MNTGEFRTSGHNARSNVKIRKRIRVMYVYVYVVYACIQCLSYIAFIYIFFFLERTDFCRSTTGI